MKNERQAEVLKELRTITGYNQREMAESLGMPLRTWEDWEAGRRTPPEYIPRLLGYQLKYEKLVRKNGGDVRHA